MKKVYNPAIYGGGKQNSPNPWALAHMDHFVKLSKIIICKKDY